MSKAFIQNPAPPFSAKAVQDGEFVDIKLSDYKGMCYVIMQVYIYFIVFIDYCFYGCSDLIQIVCVFYLV